MSKLNNQIGFMLCEQVTEAQDIVIIEENNNRVKIEAVAQEMEKINRNRRIYPSKQLKPEVTCARTQELLKTGNFFGEAGHPTSKDLSRQSTIDPNNIAHKMTKLWIEGDLIKMHTEGTHNDRGEHFNNLVMSGTKPSFSLRALGSVNNTARGAEVHNIKLITYDWVIYPSHDKAYMTGIVNESSVLDNLSTIPHNRDSKLVMEKTDSGLFVPITNNSVVNYIKNESANIHTVLNSFDILYESVSISENGNYVQLIDKDSNVLMINLESYIQNEIMDYCFKTF